MSDFLDQAKKLASEHSDLADQGLDKAAEMAKEKTGGKYDEQIETVEEKLEGFLGVKTEDDNRSDRLATTGRPWPTPTAASGREPLRRPPAARCPAPSPVGRPGQ